MTLGGLAGLVLLILVCWGGHDLYVRWQERRLVRRALVALQQGDEKTASLAARTVLEIKPVSAPAARIMAEVAEKTGNRVALDWRRKVVGLIPSSVEDKLALARCALQFGDPAFADETLKGIDETGRQLAGYHAVAALLAQARQHDDQAETEWGEAVKLAPEEKGYQLRLGTLRVRSKDEKEYKSGRDILLELRNDPKQRSAATRALIIEGVKRHENAHELLDQARELQGYPEATLGDRLLYLDFLHQSNADEFTIYLTDLENKVAGNPADLSALMEWMSQNNLTVLALDFVKTVPADERQTWPLPLSESDLYDRLKDWRNLEAATRDANWRGGEFLRHAYLARALRGQDKPAAAEHEWGEAVKQALGQGTSLLALVRVAADWKWDKEMLDLLWTLTRDPDKQNEAVQTLYRYYVKVNDTQGLYRVLARWTELAPDNLDIRNNFAQVSLLLDANAGEARRIAADLYQRAPSNPAYATTYAYSLLTKGNRSGAIKVMSSLNDEQLRDPAISAYYGICLAAVHDGKAREYLEIGQRAKLLPEEKSLVDKALASLSTASTAN